MTHLSPAQAAANRKHLAQQNLSDSARRVFLGDRSPEAVAGYWAAERELREAMDVLDRACGPRWKQ